VNKDLKRIGSFLEEHHVMSLATSIEEELSVCSLFYCYIEEKQVFLVASSPETMHIKHIKENSKIAGNILLETDTIGEIRGVQFRGELLALEDSELKKCYFKKFPYALVLMPTLWQIKVNFFKMTDNRLGFGKKLIWEDSSL
jgi:hypothetical protein